MAAASLYAVSPTPFAEEWDIDRFYHTGYPDANDPPCANTFSYLGQCFYAGSLNYLLWGRANELAGYSLTEAVAAVWLWKHEYGYNPVWTAQAIAMTIDGYNEFNEPTSTALPCSLTEVEVPEDDTDWIWWPWKPSFH